MPTGFSDTPPPPYHAVIFTSRLSSNDDGYEAMGHALAKLAQHQPGYLGMETTRGCDVTELASPCPTGKTKTAFWHGKLK